MNLFEIEPFTLPSGLVTHFKIECDAIKEGSWAALARLASIFLPSFSQVEGVPRGGLAFARALEPYASPEGGLLIVDDVWVTGQSMERWRCGRDDVVGLVAYARAPVLPWVIPMFQMNPLAEQASYLADVL